MTSRSELIESAGGVLEVRVRGQGPAVVLLPSLGRGAGDFDDLADRLALAGYRALAPEPRGVGASTGLVQGLSMEDLAGDVAAVVRAMTSAPATIVGHAFGNRIARMVATRHPDLVDGVGLLACGGQVPPIPEAATALSQVFDVTLDLDAHLEAVRAAFFAEGNDASAWADGWYPMLAAVQGEANRMTPVGTWWRAGQADVFVVQPANDRVAVPANGDQLLEALGGRATMVTIPRAGHALLPEQPAAVAAALAGWLDDRRSSPPRRSPR